MTTPRSPFSPSASGEMIACRVCGRPVAARALFCHQCGAIQAPLDLDAYARLNLPPRFDIDMAALDRQVAGFRRILAPERLSARPVADQDLGAAHLRAVETAYATLRDPVRRARLLLTLLPPGPDRIPAGTKGPDDADIHAVAAELAAARDRPAFDDLDGALIGFLAAGIFDLAAAFRDGALAAVPRLADRLERLQRLAGDARMARAGLEG